MYYFVFKQVLSPTSHKDKQTARTKTYTEQFKGNYTKNKRRPFDLKRN